MQIAKPLVLTVIAISHAFLFLYVWMLVGSTTLTSIGSSTGSFFLGSLAASMVTALFVTAPAAYLSGNFSDNRTFALVVASFPIGWAALSVYFSGVRSISDLASTPRVLEFAAIAIVGLTFTTLGMRARALRSKSS